MSAERSLIVVKLPCRPVLKSYPFYPRFARKLALHDGEIAVLVRFLERKSLSALFLLQPNKVNIRTAI